MKVFTKITFILLCLLACQAAQSQNDHWALFPLSQYTPASNTLSALAGVPPSQCQDTYFSTRGANGIFDDNGNPLFYVAGNRIYNRNGQVMHTIDAPYCPKEFNICPVPGGLCGDYYILYATVGKTSDPTYRGYEVVAQRVSVDANQDLTIGASSKVLVSIGINVQGSAGIATALSKENNGERKYYLTLMRTAYDVTRIKVNAQGISLDGGFASVAPTFSQGVSSFSMEISPDQRYLAFIESHPAAGAGQVSDNSRLIIKDFTSATTPVQAVNIPYIGSRSDIEFGANSNDLYITSYRGLIKTTASNPASYNYVPYTAFKAPDGFYSPYYEADIELATDGNLYLASKNNVIVRYNTTTGSLTNMRSHQGLILPEQVDGENMSNGFGSQNLPTLAVNISVGFNATLIAQASGGSGNYSYTWNSPGPNNYSTSAILNACGNFLHKLVVRDNSTGCSIAVSYYYNSGKNCNSEIITPFRRVTSQNITPSTTQIQLLPNPASEQVKVQVGSGEKIIQLQITSLQGKTVARHKGNAANKQTVSLQGLKTGIYVLTVTTNKSSSQQKLVIK